MFIISLKCSCCQVCDIIAHMYYTYFIGLEKLQVCQPLKLPLDITILSYLSQISEEC